MNPVHKMIADTEASIKLMDDQAEELESGRMTFHQARGSEEMKDITKTWAAELREHTAMLRRIVEALKKL